MPPTAKHCPRCDTDKPIEDFPTTIGKRKRVHAYCKICNRKYQRDQRRKARGLPADAPLKLGPPAKPDGHCYIHKRGRYVMEKRTGHHRADQYGYVPQHILVAEAKYGIPITDDFTVHHKNRQRGDNHPDNLELRLGAHGKGGDVLDTLLDNPAVQVAAAAILRRYGWHITAPVEVVA